jgi:hypothetical protein
MHPIVHRIGRKELAVAIQQEIMKASSNKMHVCYKIKMEWGIRRLKHEWRH